MRAFLRFGAASLAIAGCGLSLTGTTGDSDASVEETPADAAPDVADARREDEASPGEVIRDGGADADAVADADAGPPPPPPPPPRMFECPGGDTTDCATCTGRPLGCVLCGAGGAHYSVCVPAGSSCWQTYRPAGYDWCRCAFPQGTACVLPNQGCNPYDNGVCVTCGENQTQGDRCKGGGTCNQTARRCE